MKKSDRKVTRSKQIIADLAFVVEHDTKLQIF